MRGVGQPRAADASKSFANGGPKHQTPSCKQQSQCSAAPDRRRFGVWGLVFGVSDFDRLENFNASALWGSRPGCPTSLHITCTTAFVSRFGGGGRSLAEIFLAPPETTMRPSASARRRGRVPVISCVWRMIKSPSGVMMA